MEIRVSPGAFIRGPYITCPNCGQNAFGVLIIVSHQYSRRCKNCLFPGFNKSYPPTRLPLLNKKIIYLDQFVISNMMHALNPASKAHNRGDHREFYIELFKRLDLLGKKQLIGCPESEFHLYESLPTQYFQSLRRMYTLLSGGMSFNRVNRICRSQIWKTFRCWLNEKSLEDYKQDKNEAFSKGVRTGWTGRFSVSVNLGTPPFYLDELRKERETISVRLEDVFERWRKEKGREFLYWVAKETKGLANRHSNSDIHRMGAALNQQEAITETQWQEYLHSKHFAEVPCVKLEATIWATVAYRAANIGQRKAPNQGFSNDVSFISTFLPYCDAMFVDKECHGILDDKLMRDTVKQYGETKVFSLKNKEDFMSYLDRVDEEATPEHLALLAEVYGEINPYVELYDTPKEQVNRSGPKDLPTRL